MIKQAVILAGGRGTRIKEYTSKIPKPMIEIKNKPIIKHIVDFYFNQGVENIIIAAGYKKKIIQDYFQRIKKVKVIDTGLKTLTGGRIKRLSPYLESEFFLTYGDGISDVKLKSLYKAHQKNGLLATITAVNPYPRFGEIIIKNNKITNFNEKKKISNTWINGGFFTLNKKVLKYIKDDYTNFEKNTLKILANKKKIAPYFHKNYWQCVDTIRDKELIEDYLKKHKLFWQK